MQIDCVSSPGLFDALSSEWEALAKRAEFSHSMVGPKWLSAWHATIPKPSDKLHVFTFRDKGKLVAVVPLIVKTRRLGKVAVVRRLQLLGTGLSDYCQPLCLAGTGEVAAGLADSCLQLKREWDELWFGQLVATHPFALGLRRAFQERGERLIEVETAPCPWIKLEGSFEHYYATRGRNLKQNFKRQENRLEREGIRPVYRRHSGLSPDLLNRLVQIDAEKKHGSLLSDARIRAFVTRLFSYGPDGPMELWTADLEGTPESYAILTRDERCRSYWLLATSTQASRFSLGSFLLKHLIEISFQEGLQQFDFLRGSERYKQQWATDVRHLSCLGLLSPSLVARTTLGLRLGLQAGLSWLKRPGRKPAVGRTELLNEEFGAY